MEDKDEKKNEGVGTGDKTDNDNKEDKKDLSEFDKLKASNDEFEKQLVRGRELKAESQKLEAEKMMAGGAGGHVDSKPAAETPKEYNDRVEKELGEGKHVD